MAKVLSPVWSMIRGSIAGTCYTANQYASIIAKQRVAPATLPSVPQTLLRSSFSAAAQDWGLLTLLQRQAWDNYALTVPFVGPMGTYTVSGRSLFLGTRAFARYLNARYGSAIAFEDDPPPISGRYAVDSIEVGLPEALHTGFRLTLNNYSTEKITYQLDIAGPFAPTRMKWSGGYDNAKSSSGSVAAATSQIIYVSDLVADMAYFWRLRAITTDGVYQQNALTQVWTGRAIALVAVP